MRHYNDNLAPIVAITVAAALGVVFTALTDQHSHKGDRLVPRLTFEQRWAPALDLPKARDETGMIRKPIYGLPAYQGKANWLANPHMGTKLVGSPTRLLPKATIFA